MKCKKTIAPIVFALTSVPVVALTVVFAPFLTEVMVLVILLVHTLIYFVVVHALVRWERLKHPHWNDMVRYDTFYVGGCAVMAFLINLERNVGYDEAGLTWTGIALVSGFTAIFASMYVFNEMNK